MKSTERRFRGLYNAAHREWSSFSDAMELREQGSLCGSIEPNEKAIWRLEPLAEQADGQIGMVMHLLFKGGA